MKSPVLFLNTDMAVADAAKFLIENRISGAPVVDGANAVGVLTMKDVARHSMIFLRLDDLSRSMKQDEVETQDLEKVLGDHLELLKDVTVRAVMRPRVITVSEDSQISEVLQVMLNNHIHRVFVTNKEGGVIGVITTFDIIRWLNESVG
jgi:predicted transcriptional regulator